MSGLDAAAWIALAAGALLILVGLAGAEIEGRIRARETERAGR